MAKGTSPRRAASSWALPRFSVARTSVLEREAALVTRGPRSALERDEAADPLLGEVQQRVEASAGERRLLGGPLDLHELSAAGHDDVHVDLGARILDVVEVEDGLASHDPHAHRGDVVAKHGVDVHARDA